MRHWYRATNKTQLGFCIQGNKNSFTPSAVIFFSQNVEQQGKLQDCHYWTSNKGQKNSPMTEQLEQKYLKYYLPCPQTQILTNQELQDYNQESQIFKN